MSDNSGWRSDRLTVRLRRYRWHTKYNVLRRLSERVVYTVTGIELEANGATAYSAAIRLWCQRTTSWRPRHLTTLRRDRYKMSLNPVMAAIYSQLGAAPYGVCLMKFNPGAHLWAGSPGATISTSVWAGKGYPIVKT